MATPIVDNGTATKRCEHCDTSFPRRTREPERRWAERRFCTHQCAKLWRGQQQRTAHDESLFEDLEWLIDPTAPRLAANEVARRLGYARIDSLYRRLYRAGRDDLAARLQQRDETAA